MIENFKERETTTRLRQRDHWCNEIKTTRSAAPMSFGSRMRSVLAGSVLGGDDLDGGAGAGVRSRWWSDLEGGGNVLQVVAGFRRRRASIDGGV